MRKPGRLLLALISPLMLAIPAMASDDSSIIEKYSPPRIDIYNIARTNRVTRQSNVWLNTTNWGILGNYGISAADAMEDPEFPGTWAPQCEFPGGSGVQYLFMGSPWIGALVQEGDSVFARVSCGTEGWTGPGNNQFELNPGEVGLLPIEEHGILERSSIPGAVNYLGENIYSPDAVAHQEFISVYCDTLTEVFWTGNDIVDGPHFPLGVRITQKVMGWNAIGFEDFIVLEYTIENIGSYDLKNLYLGHYIDSDVGWIGESQSWHTDDVTGFLQIYNGDTLNLPYIADNDGRPANVGSGNDFTCPGVSGLYTLLSPADVAYTSFNWWISNGNPDLDFGPNWVDDGAPGSWTDTLGTPNGDERKYFVMSNREIDYDQWFVADQAWIASNPQIFTDPFTGETTTHEWRIEDYPQAGDLANGYDTRYLISSGPLGDNVSPPGEIPETYLYPGDSLKITFAYVCGEGFHDPDNPQGDLTGTGPIDPGKYVYDDLVYNCSKVQFLFDTGFQLLLPYSPLNFRVVEAPDTAVVLAWNPYTTIPGVGVNIFRRIEGEPYPLDPINSEPIQDTIYVDMGVSQGGFYFYQAQAVSDTLLSCFTPEIATVVGAPMPPTGLAVDSAGNGIVHLSWDPNIEPDLDHYVIYRFETDDTSAVLEPIDSVLAGTETYADCTVTNGIEYTYSMTAVDSLSLESFFSDSVMGTPMGFYEELLVIREKVSYGVIFEWPDDSLESYYQQLFLEVAEDPDLMTIATFPDSFPTLPELSPYKTIWLINDNHALVSTAYFEIRNPILEDYLASGGKLIVSGRRIFNGGFGFNTGWTSVSSISASSSLLENYFKIDSVYATDAVQLMFNGLPEFTSSVSLHPGYPDLEVDTTKVALMVMPPLGWIYLPEVDVMIPTYGGEVIYTFGSAWPDTSSLQGHAVGIRSSSPTEPTFMLTFPLYAMQPYESVKALTERILDYYPPEGPEREIGPSRSFTDGIVLKQSYPNPFNAWTMLEFDISTGAKVTLKVYNITGQCVATLLDQAHVEGPVRVPFDGANLASGIYFARLEVGPALATIKMVLLK